MDTWDGACTSSLGEGHYTTEVENGIWVSEAPCLEADSATSDTTTLGTSGSCAREESCKSLIALTSPSMVKL